jgi:hypothetical protein
VRVAEGAASGQAAQHQSLQLRHRLDRGVDLAQLGGVRVHAMRAAGQAPVVPSRPIDAENQYVRVWAQPPKGAGVPRRAAMTS